MSNPVLSLLILFIHLKEDENPSLFPTSLPVTWIFRKMIRKVDWKVILSNKVHSVNDLDTKFKTKKTLYYSEKNVSKVDKNKEAVIPQLCNFSHGKSRQYSLRDCKFMGGKMLFTALKSPCTCINQKIFTHILHFLNGRKFHHFTLNATNFGSSILVIPYTSRGQWSFTTMKLRSNQLCFKVWETNHVSYLSLFFSTETSHRIRSPP